MRNEEKPSTLAVFGLFIFMFAFVAFAIWLGPNCGIEKSNPPRKSAPVKQPPPPKLLSIPATVNGYDEASKTIINPVRVWKDYNNRNLGMAGTVQHGQEVIIIKKSGQGRKIRTNSGTEGWVTQWFLKEK